MRALILPESEWIVLDMNLNVVVEPLADGSLKLDFCVPAGPDAAAILAWVDAQVVNPPGPDPPGPGPGGNGRAPRDE